MPPIFLVWILIPLLVGLSQPVLWQMNLRVAQTTGYMEAAVLLHVVGAAAGFGFVFAGMRGDGGLVGMQQVPWWAWTAGVIGVAGMAAMNRALPELGVATLLALTVAAQFIAALVFEHYGLMGAKVHAATLTRWFGAALLVGGAWLVSR